MDDAALWCSGQRRPTTLASRAVSPKLLQLMHFQLIEAQQRIRYLEDRLLAPQQ
jgi:hypothetical protein